MSLCPGVMYHKNSVRHRAALEESKMGNDIVLVFDRGLLDLESPTL